MYYLDRARSRLHLPAYRLPANFTSLGASRQAFILANLDRVLYHLRPITGLTATLDRVARGGRPGDPGVLGDGDPFLNDPRVQTGSDWASGFPNIVLAYESWMYDDGYRSPNLDCTSPGAPLCWGHRHVILEELRNPGPSAMGVAAGRDRSGVPGYALLLGKGRSPYTRGYFFRWRQAVADGAGRHVYRVRKP